MEVASIKAEADHRRTAELEEVRAQMQRLRQASAEQARVAAEEAVAKEVARAKAIAPPPVAPLLAPISVREFNDDGFVADGRNMLPAIHVPTQETNRKPWMIAAAVAVVALIGAALMFGFKGRTSAPATTAAAPAAATAAVPAVKED